MVTKASRNAAYLVMLSLTAILVYGLFRKIPVPEPIVKDLRTIQGHDAAFGYRLGKTSEFARFDHRLIQLSTYEKALLPSASHFDFPMGAANGSFAYNAQKFGDDNPARGGKHTGDDLNGIGGMNSDYGDAVYNVADGMVLYTGIPSAGWGKTVIIAHRMPDGKILQSMYAHLKEIRCVTGQTIARGQFIGSVGTADGQYLAHLHFEMRASTGIDLGAGYASDMMNRIDPTATILAYRKREESVIVPSSLPAALIPKSSEEKN